MGEMAAVGQVQSHNSAVGLDDGRVDGEVGRRAGQRLHIHSPLLGIQSEHLNYFFFYFFRGILSPGGLSFDTATPSGQ